MKRKVIKQGHNTLTMTLPSKWAGRFNLQAGDEIEVDERDNGLFLSTTKHDELKSTRVDISNLDIPSIWKFFMAVYREGYDEVTVKFEKKMYESPYKYYTQHRVDDKYQKVRKISSFEVVQEIANRFIGFEVIEHRKNYCIIKNMAQISEKEFDSSLRRVFLLIQQMASDFKDACNKNNHEIVEHTHDIDINVDKFHDFCVRILNKTNFKNARKSNLLFTTLYVMELLGDEFKHCAVHVMRDMKNSSLKNIKELSNLIYEHFNRFYDFYYKFDSNKVKDISKRDLDIYVYLPKAYHKKKGLSEGEVEIMNHLRRIVRYINALVELRIEMEY